MKLVIGSINWAQGNRIMSSFYHFETSARTGHRLSSFADGSDCPTIGPDGECCRCIGQALLSKDLGQVLRTQLLCNYYCICAAEVCQCTSELCVRRAISKISCIVFIPYPVFLNWPFYSFLHCISDDLTHHNLILCYVINPKILLQLAHDQLTTVPALDVYYPTPVSKHMK